MNTTTSKTNTDKGLVLPNPAAKKKDLAPIVAEMISRYEGDPIEGVAFLKKMAEVISQSLKELSPIALAQLEQTEEVLGGTMSWQGGGVVFNGAGAFGHWDRWVEAKAALDEIQGLMKAAFKQKGAEIFTDDGEQVPAAIPSTRNPYLKYQF